VKQVLYISTDGLRPDALSKARTPNLQALMQRGSYTMTAQAVMPSVTLPCHMSVFHSVPPERHGTTTNTYTPMARPIKSLLEVLSDAGKSCASFFSWEPLRDIGRPGSLRHISFTDYVVKPNLSDKDTVETAGPYVKAASFDFCFLYLGMVDVIGHDHGWMSERYLQQVEHTDMLIGRVLDILPSTTTLILHSDHGGHGRNHGTDSPEDMAIPWLIMGDRIKANHEMKEDVSLLDTAPTVAHVLGVTPPPQWEGKVIASAFL